jgi:hypothetical protein
MVVATKTHLVSERDLVAQSVNMRPCVGIHLVHRLSAKFQKRRAIPIEFVQLVHAERLRLSCTHTSQLSETQSVTRSCVIPSGFAAGKKKLNKIAKPYEILGFMIILKSTRKTTGAARNAGSNYRQRHFVLDLDKILFSQPQNSKSSEIRFGDHRTGYGTWELFIPNFGIDSQRKILSADSVTELWVMSEEGRFPNCSIKASAGFFIISPCLDAVLRPCASRALLILLLEFRFRLESCL